FALVLRSAKAREITDVVRAFGKKDVEAAPAVLGGGGYVIKGARRDANVLFGAAEGSGGFASTEQRFRQAAAQAARARGSSRPAPAPASSGAPGAAGSAFGGQADRILEILMTPMSRHHRQDFETAVRVLGLLDLRRIDVQGAEGLSRIRIESTK